MLFSDRFAEAVSYYAALFDYLHEAAAAAAAAAADERARVERVILGEEIKNILLCEGVRRHERHERLSQCAAYMEGSRFGHVPLSFGAIRVGREKLMGFGLRGCQGKEDGGCLLLGWGSTPLYSVSAWRPHQGSTFESREHMPVPK
ncbi:hypothetical protein ACP4OV_003256 [Aristida adscensionis]